MRRSNRRSSNIEDRRGQRMRRGFAGGGLGTILLIILALLFGFNPLSMLDLGGGAKQQPVPSSATGDEKAAFISQVLHDNEVVWGDLFSAAGRRYEEPKLVLFTGATQSACGFAQAAMGPFYCPGDHKIYIDLRFYDELKHKFGATGDFAQAYVISHEVGHHVQTLLGLSDRINRAKARGSRSEANELSVAFELQADCLAGVWANHAHQKFNLLERGDVEEAIRAAAAIGDDQIQRKTQGYVVPDSFTHGSSEQRARWFMRGLESGDSNDCQAFE